MPGVAAGQASTLVVGPYLQSAEPDSVWILWETDSGDESVVEWGATAALGNVASGTAQVGNAASRIHEVQLTSLSPQTRYHYKVRTDAVESAVFDFVTPARAESEAALRLAAVSDMQQSAADPAKYYEVLHDGLLDHVTTTWGADLPAELDLVLVPGDLVNNGWSYGSWRTEFFDPGADLMARIPFYPVLGNHEANAPFYFGYFHLPENGTAGELERWWYVDRSNLRIIGLDSNNGFRTAVQLGWLSGVLAEACTDDSIDFVFAQLHHPHHSELWTPGNLAWTGDVIAELESFSTTCGKPSVHFYGHTHGYSRGQSRDHAHLMINVASAGGAIDYWGEHPQQDYAEHVISTDDWGFVMVEVEAGPDPQFEMTRLSRGNRDGPLDNVETDSVVVRRFAEAPRRPDGLAPGGRGLAPECVLFLASEYLHDEGVAHGSTHWQVSEDCDDFSAPAVERWVQHLNLYMGEDLQAGDDLNDEEVHRLEPETEYCWRVRYRDRGLVWSGWSEPMEFSTGAATGSSNLLVNPGAEGGVAGWQVREGFLESLSAGECNGISPHTGDRYFAVGGLCQEAGYAEAFQEVDLSARAAQIDAGELRVDFGGWFADWAGADLPEMELVFRDLAGAELARSQPLGSQVAAWTPLQAQDAIPPGTRSIEVVLMGTRSTGQDNDSYLDELFLRVGPEVDCSPSYPEAPEPGPPPGDPSSGQGCGACGVGFANAPSGGAAWLAALLAGCGLRRRAQRRR
jgi:3',5'-cyclic AMP phosphodiesterase CpdA